MVGLPSASAPYFNQPVVAPQTFSPPVGSSNPSVTENPFIVTPAPGYNASAGTMPSAAPSLSDRMIGIPTPQALHNGTAGYFQQAANQYYSNLTVLIPIDQRFIGPRFLVPEMLIDGSPQTKELMERCATEGIAVDAGVAGDQMAININGPAGKEREMIQVAMGLLTRPQVDGWTFQTIQQNLLKALEETRNMPETPLHEMVVKQLYGANHPLAHATDEIIGAIRQATPQSAMAVYQQVVSQPQNLKLTMVSSLPVDQQAVLVNQGIAQAGWYTNPLVAKTVPPSIPIQQLGQGPSRPVLVPSEALDRAHVIKSWLAPTVGDPDYASFVLLTKMLGGMTGGFFRIMRTERGLVYSTQQSYTPHQNGASYKVMAQVDYDKIPQALEGLKQAVQEVVTQPIAPEVLEKVKQKYLVDLRAAKQSSEGIAGLSLPWLVNGKDPKHPADLENQIKAVTADDIRRVALRVFGPSGYEVIGISAPQAILQQAFPGYPLTNRPGNPTSATGGFIRNNIAPFQRPPAQVSIPPSPPAPNNQQAPLGLPAATALPLGYLPVGGYGNPSPAQP
ncbi:MAG: insulinase family protein [Candidatus Melainabacteria bacterium]|nr:insulinase family protein [Candidatus Melainabacteria bacterium]